MSGRLNWGRVLFGGALAGVVIFLGRGATHGLLLDADWQAFMLSMNRKVEQSPLGMAIFGALSLASGVALVWLYAALRPRYGAGAQTAVIAALAFWTIGYVLPTLAWASMQIFSWRMLAVPTVVGLLEIVVAALAGAIPYREPADA